MLLQVKDLLKNYQIQGLKNVVHIYEDNFVAIKYSKIERIESLCFPEI